MIVEHFAAAKGLLVTDGFVPVAPNADPPDTGIPLYDGQISKTPPYPYVHLSLRTNMDAIDLADTQTLFEGTLVVLHVAATGDGLRIIQDRTRSALLNVLPQVAGRKCWKLARPSSDQSAEDKDVTLTGANAGLHPMYIRDYWRLASVPASA